MKIEDIQKLHSFANQNAHGSVWPFKPDMQEHWAAMNSFLTKEECKTIVELGNKYMPSVAKIRVEDEIQEIRDSKISWLYPTEETEWLYRKITDAVMELNEIYFKFNLFGLTEGLQFTKYDAPTGKYEKHIDKFLYGVVRKLSMTIQLSDPEEYEGGELALHVSGTPTTLPKEQGKLVAFPSYALHEVTPVTKGTRYSLVSWVTGPPFK